MGNDDALAPARPRRRTAGKTDAAATATGAIDDHRSRRPEQKLEAAYRLDAAESERLAGEWAEVDAPLSDA